jgi:hypothetical protein
VGDDDDGKNNDGEVVAAVAAVAEAMRGFVSGVRTKRPP